MSPNEELVVAEALQELRGEGGVAPKPAFPWPFGGGPMSSSGSARSPVPPQVRTPTPQASAVPRSSSRSLSPAEASPFASPSASAGPAPPAPATPVAPTIGRWQGMLLSATSFLLPAETQVRLRQLVRVLRLANDNLSEKVNKLKEAMDQESAGVKPKLSANAIRQDIVATVRKSTNVISTFATNSLPERARFAVRTCLLALPSQWASQMESAQRSKGGITESAVLSLANESLVMIRNVIAIIDDTLYRAESWCQKLGKHPRQDDTEEEVTRQREKDRRELGLSGLPPLAPTASSDSLGSTNVSSPNMPLTPNMPPQIDEPAVGYHSNGNL